MKRPIINFKQILSGFRLSYAALADADLTRLKNTGD